MVGAAGIEPATPAVGKYPAMKPQTAAEKALGWRVDDVDVLAEKESRRRAAAEAAVLSKHRTLRKYLEGPYKRHQDRKKTGFETLAIIRSNFAGYLDCDMASLTRSDVLEWQQKRESEGRAHPTLKRAFGALKTMLRHATRQDPPILRENPLERVNLEPPTDRERAEEFSAGRSAARRMLSDDEIQRLHTGLYLFDQEIRGQRRRSRKHGKPNLPELDGVAYAHWFVPFSYCAMYTGMRPGDLYSLTWQELNIRFGRLVKVPEKTRHHAAPAKIMMDIPDELAVIMDAWWKQHGKSDSGLVFPSPVTGYRMDKKAHSRAWRRVKRLGGLSEDLTFYALRHHFISTLVSAGVPLFTVAQLAGHKSASMIESHYGHLCPTASRNALNLLAERIAARPQVPTEGETGGG